MLARRRRRSRSRPGSRSSATGSTRSTGSSTGRSSTARSRRSSPARTSGSCSASRRCSRPSAAAPTWPSPSPRSPSPRSSARSGPSPADSRPALLPPPLRRAADARGVRGPPPRRGRHRGAPGRAHRRRGANAGTRSGVALAPRTEGAAMSRRGTTRLAWAVCAIAIALAFAALVFLILNSSTPGVSNFGSSRIGDALFGIVVLAFPAVGALIASRRPQNPIGWIFVGLGSLFAVAAFANQYALYALLTEPGSLPAGETMAWLGSWLLLPPLFLAATLLFLLFPEGRLLSRRWVPVVWIVVGAIVLALLGEMFSPHTLEDFEPLTNPYAAEGALADALESVANCRLHSHVRRDCRLGSLARPPLPPGNRARAPAAQVGRERRRPRGRHLCERPAPLLVHRRRRRLGAASAPGHRHDPGGGRDRHPPLPALRDRPDRQPGASSTARSRRCSSASTSGPCSGSRRSSPPSAGAPTWPSPSPRSPWPRSFVPCGPECSERSTGASTAAAMTPSARSRPSPPGCATRSTSPRSTASSPPWCGERWSPSGCRSGFVPP